MTESQRRALEIVRDNPGIRPGDFAKKMWPDKKTGPQGGGRYLGKLAKQGWLGYKDNWGVREGYFLLRAGKDALGIPRPKIIGRGPRP